MHKIDFDYKNFSFKKLFTREYAYLFMILYWVLYCVVYYILEALVVAENYRPVHSALDDVIPFCEFFIVPYVLWYAHLFFEHLYLLIFDTKTFKKLMLYIIIVFTVSHLTYVFYPTCQNLRPDILPRDNIFSDAVLWLYNIDTNTNVCPSMHVSGALGLMFAAIHSEKISKVFKIGLSTLSILTVMATVFLKQHSVVDVFWALPVSFLAYYLLFLRNNKKKKVS